MNCTTDPNASVSQFVYKTYSILHEYFSNLDHNEHETKTWFLMRFDLVDYFMIAVFAFFWKCARAFFMKNISQPCVKSFNVGRRHAKRTEECIWNLVNDVGFWVYVFSLCVQATDRECNLYYTPSKIFDNISDAVPLQIKLFYFLQLGKYSFGIYAVLYLDEKRKDFPVMVMHHIVTLILLMIGYVSRVVKSGLIVLLIHSVSDMILNCAKILLYSRPKTVTGNNLNKLALYILATCFTFSWFINRLYLYPLRAIYYLSFFSVKSAEGRIFGIAYLLLLSVFLMDVYWTYYLSKFLWRLFVYDRQLYDPVTDEIQSNSAHKPKDAKDVRAPNATNNNSSDIDYKKIH